VRADLRRRSKPALARLVTEVLAPANLVTGLLLVVAWHSAPSTATRLAWGALAAAFAGVLPLVYLLRGARQGRWEDHHVGEREKRPAVILAILASVLVGTTFMAAAGAPRELTALMGAMIAGLLVTLAVTLVWKISVHAAVASGTVVVLTLVFGPAASVLWPLAALVCWSRVALRDHTTAQVLGGSVAGGLVAYLAFVSLR
jgi:membrane-associated phospholipid phosphatase